MIFSLLQSDRKIINRRLIFLLRKVYITAVQIAFGKLRIGLDNALYIDQGIVIPLLFYRKQRTIIDGEREFPVKGKCGVELLTSRTKFVLNQVGIGDVVVGHRSFGIDLN